MTLQSEQVETLLKTQDPVPVPAGNQTTKGINMSMPGPRNPQTATPNMGVANTPMGMGGDPEMDNRWQNFNGESPRAGAMDDFNFNSNMGMPMNNVGGGNFTWEMIGLGLEEPLPPQETIDELHQVYFEKVHPSMPMIHRYRYLAAMNL
jgi:hypothetical protein